MPADPANSVCCFTHIDDVARGLELAVDKIQLINGSSVYPVFDLVGDRFEIRLLLEADARMFGANGRVEMYKPEGVGVLDAIGRDPGADPKRAKQILGWEPNKLEFVKNTHIYANSFVAALALAKERDTSRRPLSLGDMGCHPKLCSSFIAMISSA